MSFRIFHGQGCYNADKAAISFLGLDSNGGPPRFCAISTDVLSGLPPILDLGGRPRPKSICVSGTTFDPKELWTNDTQYQAHEFQEKFDRNRFLIECLVEKKIAADKFKPNDVIWIRKADIS